MAVVEAERRAVGRPGSRDILLDAAAALVMEKGGASLTLDAVAKRAGISKGGLLYNFPTKEALLDALISREYERMTAAHDAATEAVSPAIRSASARSLTGYAVVNFGIPSGSDRVTAGLLVGAAHEPALLAPYVEGWRARWREMVGRDGSEQAKILALAMDGLWFLEVLGFLELSAKERNRLRTTILNQIKELDQ